MSNIDYNTSEYIIIYAYSLPHVTTHNGCIKVGKASIKLANYAAAADKTKAVEDAARKRINEQLGTAQISYVLEIECVLGIRNDGKSFMDHDVHTVLKRSGIPSVVLAEGKTRSEWFKTTRETVVNAIEATKNGYQSLNASQIVPQASGVEFRKGSQTLAIEKTIKAINAGKSHFLWDAKMRFGKTLTALEIVRKMKYGKTLIITHRPEVNDDWFSDFNLLFSGTDYKFGSRDQGERIQTLQNQFLRGSNDQIANPFVYFASVQYLRHEVKSLEKLSILNDEWDIVIIDEADEGIKTALADEILSQISRTFTLMLSGTPFNLLEDYKEDEIFSWDYTAEQDLKTRWGNLYPDEPNPYYKLPKLSIFIYDLNKYISKDNGDPLFEDLYDKAFNFKEFFRTDEEGSFKHERYVKQFLDLISKESSSSFPYSTAEFRSQLRHTLWMVPGVKEARALEKMLSQHPVFTHFNIANVAGDGNEEIVEKKSRSKVKNAITNDPLSAYSITISCGKMTRGVSVPEWSAVFMLSNTTSASTYLQTIFRGQTPWEYGGLLKTECFVFDFAPDRTLNVVAEVMNIRKKSPTTGEIKEATGKFLNFCPVVSATNGEMKLFSAQKLLHAIKKVAIQKVTRNGFDDIRLYNLENLSLCSDDELEDFAELNKIVGQSRGEKESNKVKMADNGFTEEEREKAEKATKKPKAELTEEEKMLLQRKKEIAEQRKTRISILRGISIRMPMLIFGCKIDRNGNEIKADDEISLEQFIENVDDESWSEFMPDGVSKEMLREKFAKYYDDEVFIGAGIDIRLRALAADLLPPSERVVEIAEIFKGFKNPDKETVLTPWHVVNQHLSTTLGGSDFNDIIEFEIEKDQKGQQLGLPNWVYQGDVTSIWENRSAKVLDINSKSGLYPLLSAYNFYTRSLPESIKDGYKTESDVFHKLWDAIIERNIFVLCKSPMAKTIAERTLVGYSGSTTNIVYIPDLIKKLKSPSFDFKRTLLQLFREEGVDIVKFDAVIGNPPYQETTSKSDTQTQGNSSWIYQHFQFGADKIGNLTSLIYPFGGWFDSPTSLNGLGQTILSDGHTLSIKAYEGTDDKRAWYRSDKSPVPIFGKGANISAGVSIVLRDMTNKASEFSYSNRIYSDTTRMVGVDEWSSLSPDPSFTVGQKLFGDRLQKCVSNKTFGIESDFVEKNPSLVSFTPDSFNKPIKLLTNDRSGSAGRAKWYYVDRSSINKNTHLIDEYKIAMTSAYPKKSLVTGEPTIDHVHGRIKELIQQYPPNSIFGRSKMLIFSSPVKVDADNFIKYTHTRFFAYMVLNEPNRSFSFGFTTPLQDFTASSDIDWSKSILEIDQQLYKKYGLSQEEINFIETRVKEMA